MGLGFRVWGFRFWRLVGGLGFRLSGFSSGGKGSKLRGVRALDLGLRDLGFRCPGCISELLQ